MQGGDGEDAVEEVGVVECEAGEVREPGGFCGVGGLLGQGRGVFVVGDEGAEGRGEAG
jgi:hypothetical protein